MKIALLSGGVGGARCARAFNIWSRETHSQLDLTAIVNIGDDFTHLGLHIAPDLDSVTYHLGGLEHRERGWGRAGDTHQISGQITRHLPHQDWFLLGDLDLGHSLIRTSLLSEGFTLSEVTAQFVQDFHIRARVLPVTDSPSPTVVHLQTDELPYETKQSFQDWWVRNKATPTPTRFSYPEAHNCTAAPGVLDALRDADLIVLAPSNPIVSVAPILNIPEVRDALHNAKAPVIGLSPIIGDAPVRGYADVCLAVAGVECSAIGVRDYYGSRTVGGLLDGWLVDNADRAAIGLAGTETTINTPKTVATDLLFTGDSADINIIEEVLRLARELGLRAGDVAESLRSAEQ